MVGYLTGKPVIQLGDGTWIKVIVMEGEVRFGAYFERKA
jgi:tellurite resistance-related uncharacterized protein